MTDYSENSTGAKKKKTVSRSVCILLVIIAVLLGGFGGYTYGTNVATSEAEKELKQQVNELEQDLSEAKAVAGNEVQEGQQNAASLQAENAELKKEVDQQAAEIADLEKQLEDASSTTPSAQ